MASDSRALTLKLLADVADFQRKMDQSEKTTEGFSGKLEDFAGKAKAAFAVAAAAAAAYAGKLLVDGVQAAIADQAAQEKLAASLRNAAGATDEQIKSTESYISKTALATGVTDDELRPALSKLAIATGDVEKAQKLATLALDIAAGSGKDLDSVTTALSKAYDGNNSALTRLGVGLSAAELKSMSFDEVTAQLSETFKNQASIQADTFQGKMDRLKVAFDEAKESVGAKLLPILTDLINLILQKVVPAAQAFLDKLSPLKEAIADNKDEFKALWDFLDKFIIPIITGALKLAFNGFITTITTAVSGVGKLVNFFQDLYDKYKAFVDLLKNNPLSKWLGSMNPFGNASYSSISLANAGATPGISGSGSLAAGYPTGLTGTDTASFLAQLNPDAMYSFSEFNNGQPLTAVQLAAIMAERANPPVVVNIGVAGDPEGTARTIRDVFESSLNRGTGGLQGTF